MCSESCFQIRKLQKYFIWQRRRVLTKSDVCTRNFQLLVSNLYKLGRMTAEASDRSKIQYREFLKVAIAEKRNDFQNFQKAKMRLDEFYNGHIGKCPAYADIWEVCKMILTLSHGQSAVERGFSVNKEVLQDNMQEKSLVAQRVIYDSLYSAELKVHQIKICKEMQVHCKNASSRYRNYLREQENVKIDTARASKRKLKQDEIGVLAKKKRNLEEVILDMEKASDQYLLQAGACVDNKEMRMMVMKGSALKKDIIERKNTLASLKISTEMLEKELNEI